MGDSFFFFKCQLTDLSLNAKFMKLLSLRKLITVLFLKECFREQSIFIWWGSFFFFSLVLNLKFFLVCEISIKMSSGRSIWSPVNYLLFSCCSQDLLISGPNGLITVSLEVTLLEIVLTGKFTVPVPRYFGLIHKK